jgi:PAS domain S-box-containing protein
MSPFGIIPIRDDMTTDAQHEEKHKDDPEPPRARGASRPGEGDGPTDAAWRALLGLSGEGIVGLDADGRCTSLNRRAQDLLGYDEAECLGRRMHELIHGRPAGSAHSMEACPVSRALASGEEVRLIPETLWHKDGSALSLLCSCSPVLEGGRVGGAIVTIVDASRAAAERERLLVCLASAEARYRGLFEGVADALLVADAEGRYVDANPAAEALLGYARAELLGMRVAEVMALAAEDTRGMYAAFVRDGRWRGDVELKRKDGTTVRAEGRATALSLPDGPLFVSALRDITERERAERASRILAEAGALLSSSLDYEATLDRVARLAVPELADWVFVELLQEDGAIERVAVAHRDPAKEALVWEYDRRYPVDPEAPAGSGRVIRTGRSELLPDMPDEMLRAIAQDDEHLRLLRELGFRAAMVVPLVARGRILGDLAFATDGSSRRRYGPEDLALAEELARRAALAVDNARLYREARTAVRARDDFLAVAAHELRTPITGLRGFAQILRRRLRRGGEVDVGALVDAAERIDRQAGRLAALVAQLLDVSRIEAGGMTLETRTVDLSELLAEAAAAAQARTDAHAVAVRRPAQLWIDADPLRLEQVLANLLDNAIKYSPGGGPIDVELGCPGDDTVRIVVADRGLGIAPEHRDRIFDRFHRAHADPGILGMGLGLHVSKQIVELHGGRLDAEPREGGGTRFVVSLPARHPPPPGPAAAGDGPA